MNNDMNKLNAKLRVLETTFGALNEVRLKGATRSLCEEIEYLENWILAVFDGSSIAHPARRKELFHYGVIYRNNIVDKSIKLLKLLKAKESLEHISNVRELCTALSDLKWLENAVGQFLSSSDVRSHENFRTMYALHIEGELVVVGDLGQCEDRAVNACDPIYEVICRPSNYRIEDGMFVISTRDIVETKRYR